MDSVFLTSRFTIIFEVKNISGQLEFRENPPQLIRTRTDGQIDGFESPAAQVSRNVDLFNEWLYLHGINLPVIGVVILAYPKQIVTVPPKNVKILFPNLVPSYIKSLFHLPEQFDLKTLDWLTTKLVFLIGRKMTNRDWREFLHLNDNDCYTNIARNGPSKHRSKEK